MKTKKVSACATITLVIISLLLLPALTAGSAVAQVAETITLSSANLNPKKVIAIDIRGDLGDGPLTLRVLDPYGAPVTLDWSNGTSKDFFLAYKVGAYRYVAYLGGTSADLTAIPANPLPPIVSSSNTTGGGIAKLETGTQGYTYTVEVVGTDLTASFLYDTVKMTLTLSPKEVAYRRGEAVITLTIADGDLNLDPTAVDMVTPSSINLTLTVFRAAGGEDTYFGNLSALVTSVVETAVNSATFKARTNVTAINNLTTTKNNLTTISPISMGDKVAITLLALEAAQGWNDTVFPVDQRGSDYVTAVYRAPTVSVSFTNQYVTIEITSPDDNVDPLVKDTLDPHANVSLSVFDKTGLKASLTVNATTFDETDKNTNIFRMRIPVSWNATISLSTTQVLLPTGVKGPFYFYVWYYTPSAASGYGIDAEGLGLYDPQIADVQVTRATSKSIVLTVTDKDLNNRDDAIEYLTADYATQNKFDLNLKRGSIVMARVQLLDLKGSLVSATGTPPATALISFVETDMNTGIFTVRINAALLSLIPEAQYILRYYDYTGGTTTDYKDYMLTVTAIGITLDRTEIPVNRDGVVLYIEYPNDIYNTDPTVRDSATVTVKITATDNTVLHNVNVTLSESGINTGVFRGWYVVPAANFSTPKIIDATLKVWDPNYPDIYVLGKFRAHDSSIEVSQTTAKWGDTITIKVKDPDANRDTMCVYYKDNVTVGIYYGNQWLENVYPVETGVNSDTFETTFKISYDDPAFANVPPGATLTIKYFDDTPVMSPTASAWTTIPYVATVKIVSTDGALTVSTAVEGYLGVLEELKLGNITVVDPDQNKYVLRADSIENAIAVSIEGIPQALSYSVNETAASSGTFILPKGTVISLYKSLTDVGVLTGTETPTRRAEILAGYVGKKVAISYIDEYSATGTRNIITKTLTLKAWTATITTSAEAVNMGEWLNITISNPEIAGTTEPTYKQAIVKSTSYPSGVVFYAEEVSAGVFQLRVQIVSIADWVPGAKQIPAKLGDAITIEYVDPVTEDGKANVLLTKTVTVGVPVERPVPASNQKFVDPNTGVEKTSGKVGEAIMLQATLTNVDVVNKSFTAIFKVKDSAGATIFISWVSGTLAPGQSLSPAVSWTPTLAGTYTVEVLVVKSIPEPTPYSDKLSMTLPVA